MSKPIKKNEMLKNLAKCKKPLKEIKIKEGGLDLIFWEYILGFFIHRRDFFPFTLISKKIYAHIKTKRNNILFHFAENSLVIKNRLPIEYVFNLIIDEHTKEFLEKDFIIQFPNITTIGFSCSNCRIDYIGLDDLIVNIMTLMQPQFNKTWFLKNLWFNCSKCVFCFHRGFSLQFCKGCKKIDKIENMKRCSICKDVYYCGKECRKKSYELHKPICLEPRIKIVKVEEWYQQTILKNKNYKGVYSIQSVLNYLKLGVERSKKNNNKKENSNKDLKQKTKK